HIGLAGAPDFTGRTGRYIIFMMGAFILVTPHQIAVGNALKQGRVGAQWDSDLCYAPCIDPSLEDVPRGIVLIDFRIMPAARRVVFPQLKLHGMVEHGYAVCLGNERV